MRIATTLCFLLGLPGMALANVSVTGDTLSGPDDGWYEVQNTDYYLYICQGGTSCETGPGVFNVINQSTAEQFENISVGSNITVSGDTISWPDNGWYQVQLASDPDSSICGGTASCAVAEGTYTVINHTTGERFEGVKVSSGSGSSISNEAPLSDAPADSASGSATIAELVHATATISDPAGSLSILHSALQSTGLDDALQGRNDRYTLFAPTDSAFNALGSDRVADLLADQAALRQLVLNHLLLGPDFSSGDLARLRGFQIQAGNGEFVVPSESNGLQTINGATITTADVNASNGFIHFIDRVLLSDSLEQPQDDDGDSDSDDDATNNGDSPITGGSVSSLRGTVTITEIATAASGFSGNTGFSTLLLALQATGLDEVLASTSSRFTVFAPTDDAFEALGDDALAALFADTERLREILLYHVIIGNPVSSTGLIGGRWLAAANDQFILINLGGSSGPLRANNAHITRTDIIATNGIIHTIDSLLIPPVNASSGLDGNANEAQSNEESADTSAGDAAETVNDTDSAGDTDADTTEPSDTDESTDSDQTADDEADVADADHSSSTDTTAASLMSNAGNTITALLSSDASANSFSTLINALESTGLSEILNSGSNTYTLLAPTDAAFANIGSDALNELLGDTERLRSALLYHVLAGRAFSSDELIAIDGRGVVAGNGLVISVTAVDSGVRLNTATVTQADIEASNGVIHVIDQVLSSE